MGQILQSLMRQPKPGLVAFGEEFEADIGNTDDVLISPAIDEFPFGDDFRDPAEMHETLGILLPIKCKIESYPRLEFRYRKTP